MEKDSINDPCRECDILEERNLFLEQNHPQSKASLEGKLQHAEIRYKRLAEASFEGIVIHDYHHFIEANQSFLDMFGYTQAEIEEIDGDDLITPEYLEITQKQKDSQSETPYEVDCKRKNGSVFPAEFRAKQININDVPFRIVAVRDLTDQKEMEQQIAESEKKYRELYSHSPVALYRVRISNGEILECNPALVELFGYDNKEEFKITSNAISRYVDMADRAVLLEKLRKEKRVEDFQVQLKRKDDKSIWVELTAEIFPDQDFLEGAIRDITTSKLLSQIERTVFRLILEGKSNKDIAKIQDRSVRTIEEHRANIMRKLEVDNIADLIKKAKSLRPEPNEQ